MTTIPVLLPTRANDDALAAAGALRALPFGMLASEGRPIPTLATSNEWNWKALASRECRGFTATLEEVAGIRTILLTPPSGTPVRLRMPTRGGLRPRRRDAEPVEADVELGMFLRAWSRAADAAVSWNPDGNDAVAVRLRRVAVLLAAVAPQPHVTDGILTLRAPSPWTLLSAEAFGSQHGRGMLLWSRDLLDAATAALDLRPVAGLSGRSVSESRRDGPSVTVLDMRLEQLGMTVDLPSPDPIEALRALEGVRCAPDTEHARWITVADLGSDPMFCHEPVAAAPSD